ncbi:tetratricopeptide repeat protein [Leptospira stimsonii]|uniref:Tetratricopeptide repeat protein n=2 Tax=Leptospira stimsonii TaxID=2202203 RepID=A0ABY2N9J7_9LEPT|nr:tetratricopeptide repeat protein [Leptospira stimsonii]TGM18985.1 tetratricopeptide repeat protein [Leptospira stimsonii]
MLSLLTEGIFSEDVLSGSHEDGEKLLEEKQYSQAEKLAVSLLTNNPSDPKAEFILTRAWIGLGREEAKRGNFERGKQFLQKAYLKWPLNQELKSEIENISKRAHQRNMNPASYNAGSRQGNTVILLDSEIYSSIQDIKEELNFILLQSKSFREGTEQFASKERFYQMAIAALGIFSLMNVVFTFLLWRRK